MGKFTQSVLLKRFREYVLVTSEERTALKKDGEVEADIAQNLTVNNA